MTVIGVVAALAIPALLSTTNNAEFKTAFKKAYANLSSVTNKIAMENGGTVQGVCSNGNNDCLRDTYLKYMAYTKKCSGTWDCFPEPGVKWLHLDGSIPSASAQSSAVLNDSMLIHFWAADTEGCSSSIVGCARILVDVNGFKKPNVTGKDIFQISVKENSNYPASITCTSSSMLSNGVCAGLGALLNE